MTEKNQYGFSTFRYKRILQASLKGKDKRNVKAAIYEE